MLAGLLCLSVARVEAPDERAGRGGADLSDIQLDYAVPADDLSDYVTLFYLFRADIPAFEDSERADHAQFRLRLRKFHATYTFYDGSTQEPADYHVIGPTSGPIKVKVTGPILLFGMGVTPAGWAAMMGGEASSALNRTIDAAGLFGATRLRAAATAMAAAPDIASCVAIAEPLVRELIQSGGATENSFVHQVDAWLSATPSPEIDDLIAETGLSRRQVERKCNALYGAPPKLLARKYRALRAAVMLANDDEGLDDVIARGFYDQSHLIREVKQFTGLTPSQIHDEPTVLQQLTIGQRSALGGKVSPLISDT